MSVTEQSMFKLCHVKCHTRKEKKILTAELPDVLHNFNLNFFWFLTTVKKISVHVLKSISDSLVHCAACINLLDIAGGMCISIR